MTNERKAERQCSVEVTNFFFAGDRRRPEILAQPECNCRSCDQCKENDQNSNNNDRDDHKDSAPQTG